MTTILAIPVLILATVLQTVLVSRLPLVRGSADLVLLTLVAWSLHDRVKTAWSWTILGGLLITFISAVPFYMPLFGYLFITLVTRLVQKRIWQTPLLAMFAISFLGTLVQHSLTILALKINGVALGWSESFTMVTLPSALMNLVLALPVYTLVSDLANWSYPLKVDV